ncbi:hypothetical protein [Paraburkholderia tropica]|uniref:hypothetical protein n=1 Tax=Paraburkholderia tropica TaxID=92647 RepID=UPI002AB6ACEB|nr:hypothetical protein [Paraburkholderia tropica]
MDQSSRHAIPALPAYASPVVTRERFAELVGLPIGVITGFANRGYIPTVSIGKYSLVNLELLRKRCLDRDFED